MNILHLAAGNRWTGAAAPAFAEVEALRDAGVEAHFAYVGGYKLEAKLAGHGFAHPVIARAQNPISFLQTVRAIRRLIADYGIDILHAHLTYDHWLARVAARGRAVRIARTFHSRRTLRMDPFTSALVRKTGSIFVVNDTFRDCAPLRGRSVTWTPPPLDTRLFTPAGRTVRDRYGVVPAAKLIAVIGKLSPGRGFEDALRAFALVHEVSAAARLMIIGHGEHRAHLEELARHLGVESSAIWAGYHEEDLPEHYRAADLLLFTAAGSDEGHRAVVEALGCGVPVAAYPIPGVAALLGPQAARMMAEESTPESLGRTAVGIIARRSDRFREAVLAQIEQFTFAPAARRLLDGYSTE